MKKLALGAVIVLALALAVAGCGGGGSKALSKEEYSSQLNQICTAFNDKQKEIGDPTSLADVGEKGPRIIDAFDDAISEVEGLKAPDELKSAAEEFVSLGKQQRDLLNEVVDAAKANDGAKAQELSSKGDALDKQSDALATQLGAPACTE